jgi:hypothetical protein
VDGQHFLPVCRRDRALEPYGWGDHRGLGLHGLRLRNLRKKGSIVPLVQRTYQQTANSQEWTGGGDPDLEDYNRVPASIPQSQGGETLYILPGRALPTLIGRDLALHSSSKTAPSPRRGRSGADRADYNTPAKGHGDKRVPV